MAETQPHPAATGGPPRLEVRWIRHGCLQAPVLDWFGRFPSATESRVDNYLLDPAIDNLSVKMRAGQTLEVKARLGQRGEFTVPHRAHGRLECWQRWSFPSGPAVWASLESPAWTWVSKVRRLTRANGRGEFSRRTEWSENELGCTVELTDVVTAGRQWWTLSFEASGPKADLPKLIKNTAAAVLAEPIPGEQLRLDESSSYSGWLRRQTR